MSFLRTAFTSNGVSLGQAFRFEIGDGLVPTMSNGVLTLSQAPQSRLEANGGTINGTLTLSDGNIVLPNGSTVDGRDISVDGAILDAINTGTGFTVRTGQNTFAHRTLQGTTSQIAIANANGSFGNPIISLPSRVVLPGSDGLVLPTGTTAQRSATLAPGLIRYNSTLNSLEVSNGTDWFSVILGNDLRLNPVNIVRVSKVPGSGEFSSIAAAMTSITTASDTNPWEVIVGPGVFNEPVITFKPFVTVRGSSQETTIIMPATATQHIVVASDMAAIRDCMLSGAGTGYAAIYCSLPGSVSYGAFHVNCIRLGANDTHVLVDQAAGTYGSVIMADIDLGFNASFKNGFVAQGAGTARINVRAASTNGTTAPEPVVLFKADGPLATVLCTGSTFRCQTRGGTGLWLRNGGSCRFVGVALTNFAKGIWCENVGAAPTMNAEAINLQNNALDLVIEHPGTIGHYSGSAARSKTTIAKSAPMTVLYTDPEATGTTMVGPIHVGRDNASTVNVTDLISYGSPMGIIDGGTMTDGGGLNIIIARGYGYVDNGGEAGGGVLDRFDWPSTSVTLPANATNFIYLTNNGTLNVASAIPDPLAAAVFGRVTTDASSVAFIENIPTQARHPTNYINRMLRLAVGPVFQNGGTVSAGTAARSLNVSSGMYWFGGTAIQMAGGTPISFRDYYHASGAWTFANATAVDNTQYDNGTNLTAMISGYYVKHALFTVGTGVAERYMLVRGQAQYASLVLAEAGALPLPPPSFGNSFSLIAAMIVQQGNANIVEFIDARPTVAFKTPTLSAAATHSNLLGLDADDHKQYLLTNGTRAMAGSLNLGNNPIANAGTINGVTITALASRLLPNGVDPLSTAAPSGALSTSSTNATGVANSLARSDHSHAITFPVTSVAGKAGAVILVSADITDATALATANTVVRRDASGNFSGGLTGNASTATKLGTARTITQSGDATGSATFDGSADITIPLTLANSGVTAGSYGSATTIPTLILDIKGRVTAASSTPVAFPVTSVAGKIGAVVIASADITDATALNTVSTVVRRDASGNFSAGTITATLSGNATSATTATSATSASTSAKLTTARAIAHSGDATGSATFDGTADITIPLTLANSGVTAGSYGSNTQVPTLAVDAKGRVTSLSNVSIAFPVTSVAGKVGAVVIASADITDAAAANTASTVVRRDASGNFSAGTITAVLTGNASTATKLATARNIAQSGDATGSASFDGSSDVTIPLTLAATGVTAGTYAGASTLVIDAKGRITSAVQRTVTGTTDQITVTNGDALTANPTLSLANNAILPGTEGVVVPKGTTAQRPTIPTQGVFRYNTDTSSFEFYQGSAWVNMATGASATRTFYFYADQLDNPTSADWSVNALAPATNDPTNGALVVRAFDDTAEEGVGFMLSIPTGVTAVNLRFKYRAATAPTAARAAVMRLHRRTLANNTAVTAWTITTLTNFAFTTNALYQYASQTITLATLGLTAGNLVQFELTRQGSALTDTLTGDMLLVELIAEFT